jgi:hypothetical protein
MSCVVSPAKSPATSAACRSCGLLFAAVAVVGMSTGAAHAIDPAATPAPSWCVARGNAQPECVYDSLVTCGFNAIVTGGQCVKVEWSVPPAATVAAAAPPPRPRRKPPPPKLTQAAAKNQTAAKNDKLFREFERWKETAK